MKAILILIDSFGPGGAEKVLYTFLQHWDKEKYAITVVPISDKGVYTSKIRSIKGIRVSPIIHNSNSFLRTILNSIIYKLIYSYLPIALVYKLFIPKNSDIEIAFCEGFTTKLLSKSTNNHSKKIAWIHTDMVNNNWPLSKGIFRTIEEEKQAYTKFDTVIGVSNIVCKGYRDLFSLSNISCIYNPIGFQIGDEDFKKNSNCINEGNHLISIGRLVYDKGYDLLINAVADIIDEGICVDLVILGEGPRRNELEKIIKERNVTNSIHLLGFKENPDYYLSRSDIFVSSSRYEGFSLAIAEAMIANLPIVATSCAGPNELLDNGNYGMLVDCSVSSLKNGLIKIILNNELRNHYKKKSAIRKKIFSIQESLLQTERLFDE